MNRLKQILAAGVALLCLGWGVFAAQSYADEAAIGEKLVRELWADMKAGNLAKIEKQIAPGFQSVHQDGTRGSKEEIELIKGLDLGEYTLGNFKVTQAGPVIIATYSVTVEETIAGRRLPKRVSMRLSSWLRTWRGWKWIMHANLNPLK